MKIVFLDFDGVIVLEHSVASQGMYYSGNSNYFCFPCIQRLNEITDKTGAVIVISSQWRLFHSEKELTDMLKSERVSAPVIGITKQHKTYCSQESIRKSEIEAMVRDLKPEAYVILDDLNLIMDNFVRTIPEIGINQSNVEKAIGILNK